MILQVVGGFFTKPFEQKNGMLVKMGWICLPPTFRG